MSSAAEWERVSKRWMTEHDPGRLERTYFKRCGIYLLYNHDDNYFPAAEADAFNIVKLGSLSSRPVANSLCCRLALLFR